MLLKSWDEGKEREQERIKCIKSLYADIILTNKKTFGVSELLDKTIGQISQVNEISVVNELYSFRALITENELKSMIQLNNIQNSNIDFMNCQDENIK